MLKTFRREITTDKIGANKGQRDNILEILQKIAYSTSLEQYETNKSLLLETQNTKAIEYFSQSWDPIKDQWVVGLATSCSLGNNTNNRLESINQKIKQVVDKNAKFDDFAQDIIVFLSIHRTEINGKLCKMTAKVPVVVAFDDSVAADYRKELTDYAYALVAGQLKKSEEVEIESHDEGRYKVINTSLTFTESHCECAFNTQYKLPCKHIFSLRKQLDKNLFEMSLVNERWSKLHYLGTFRSYQHEHQVSRSVHSPRGRVQSQQQRYRATYHVAQKLASCAAEITGQMFDVRLQQMKALLRAWERGEEVIIETTSRQGELSTCDDLPGEAATREIEHSTTDSDEVGLRINENLSPENAAAAAQANSVDSTPAEMLTNIDHEETFTADNATNSETQHNIPAEHESVSVLQDNSLIRQNSEDVENAEEMNAESA